MHGEQNIKIHLRFKRKLSESPSFATSSLL